MIASNPSTEISNFSKWGEVGCRVPHSVFNRDYCYHCREPIRVAPSMIGYPNSCSFCETNHRGSPGVNEAERLFWIRELKEYELEVEVISG